MFLCLSTTRIIVTGIFNNSKQTWIAPLHFRYYVFLSRKWRWRVGIAYYV